MSREVRVREIGNNVDQRMVVCGNAVPFEQRAKRAALLSRPVTNTAMINRGLRTAWLECRGHRYQVAR